MVFLSSAVFLFGGVRLSSGLMPVCILVVLLIAGYSISGRIVIGGVRGLLWRRTSWHQALAALFAAGVRAGNPQERLDALFFFSGRRRHTSSLRDWSSDVCSSDLLIAFVCVYAVFISAFLVFTLRIIRRGPAAAPAHAEASGSLKNAFRPHVLDNPARVDNRSEERPCRERAEISGGAGAWDP